MANYVQFLSSFSNCSYFISYFFHSPIYAQLDTKKKFNFWILTNSELNKIDYYYGSVTELVLVVDGGLIMPRADEISSSSRIVWTWVLLYTRLSRFLTSDIVVEFLFKNVVFKKVENDDHELSCQTKRKLPRYSLFVEFNILRTRIFFIFVKFLLIYLIKA